MWETTFLFNLVSDITDLHTSELPPLRSCLVKRILRHALERSREKQRGNVRRARPWLRCVVQQARRLQVAKQVTPLEAHKQVPDYRCRKQVHVQYLKFYFPVLLTFSLTALILCGVNGLFGSGGQRHLGFGRGA